jgi:hypothetical protein
MMTPTKPSIRELYQDLNPDERKAFIRTALLPWPSKAGNIAMYCFIVVSWVIIAELMYTIGLAIHHDKTLDWGKWMIYTFNSILIISAGFRHMMAQFSQGIKERTKQADREIMEIFKKQIAEYGKRMADQLEKSTGHAVADDPISLASAAIEIGENAEAVKNNPFKSILDGNLTQAEIDLHNMDRDDDEPDKLF